MNTESLDTNSYRIALPQFEGPFDLLLFFIERDELDIHDIPIAKITNDFLEYIHHIQSMNIELAAEFILVASTLMRIKAKMLLPRPVLNEAGEEIDPREELVQRLIEYKRYKSVLADLAKLESEQARRATRGFAKAESKELLKSEFAEEELVGLDLYALMKAFKRVWEKHHDQLQAPKHVIRKYPYTVDQIKERITEKLQSTKRFDFVSFVLEKKDRIYVVFSFLAILELYQVHKIELTLGEGFNNFWVEKKEQE
ncbi:MAG: chromosome segregation protein ScpA [Bacteroidetes bacterium]|nr:MAG: chromosome segregation protein ScpA [Bacteroidota bacterium]